MNPFEYGKSCLGKSVPTRIGTQTPPNPKIQCGHNVPPLNIFCWVGLGFQFFLEMTCCGMIYHIQKDSWSLEFMEFGILSGSIFCYFVWIISTWFGILSGSSQTKRRFIKNLNLFWAFLLFFSFFGFRNFDTAENPQQSQFWVDPKLH